MNSNKLLFSNGIDGIVVLFKTASKRFSDHFIDYIKVYLATIGLFIALGLGFAGISLSFFSIAKAIHFDLLYILVVPLLIAFFCVLIYLSTWCGLATIDSIIGKQNTSIKGRFAALKDRVVGFIWLNVFMGLFFLGLIPIGIITFGTALVFWTICSIFAAFIYLEHGQKGLSNLWISKQMVQGQFWRILFFLVLVYAVTFSIDIVLLKSNHPITHITSWMLNLLVTPFFIALKYEMYRQIPYPKTTKTPKNWLLASKIGFLLFVIGIIFAVKTIIQLYPNWQKLPGAPSPKDLQKLI